METNSWIDQLPPTADKIGLKEVISVRNKWWERESSKKWKNSTLNLPSIQEGQSILDQDWVTFIDNKNIFTLDQKEIILKKARDLIPWKKGPFRLLDLSIDAEWRSDFKWNRLASVLDPLEGRNVLDIGCNNGYFMFRAAGENPPPKLSVGIDPTLLFKAQFDFVQHFIQAHNTHMDLLGVEHLSLMKESFDTIFFMGIIYHHRHPIQQLVDLRESLRPGGQVILETIGIPGDHSYALFPEDRYARMRNVWFVPTISCFMNWAKKAKFIDVQIVADTSLEEDEQRLTNWCPPPHQSLKDSLNPKDPTQTIEGHPAPRRFLLSARKKGKS